LPREEKNIELSNGFTKEFPVNDLNPDTSNMGEYNKKVNSTTRLPQPINL
jgi:hypothetical protein